MLTEIYIRDFLHIQEVHIPWHGGLCIVTGETGAGKSVILNALMMALGERGDSKFVKPGASKAVITVLFDKVGCDEILGLLDQYDVPRDVASSDHDHNNDDRITLKRVITSEGRSRAYINNEPVTMGFLKQIAHYLIEIQGQFSQGSLMNPAQHLRYFDHYCQHQKWMDDVKISYKKWHVASRVVENLRDDMMAIRHVDADSLQHDLDELEKLDYRENEVETLRFQKQQYKNRHQILQDFYDISECLAHPEIETSVLKAIQILDCYQRDEQFKISDDTINLSDMIDDLDDVLGTLRRHSAVIENEHQAMLDHHLDIHAVDERLSKIMELCRKHHIQPHEIHHYIQQLSKTNDQLSNLQSELDQAIQDEQDCFVQWQDAAQKLHNSRKAKIKTFEKAVMAQLSPLKMNKAVFNVALSPSEDLTKPRPNGMDQLVFHIAANPDLPPGPLKNIASGGELSRVLLALKIVLSETSPIPTLVFDEVDSGIGGETAHAVGLRLGQLAHQKQVIAITHSPQVAASGDHHYKVAKEFAKDKTSLVIKKLEDKDRDHEIARMISGDQVTDLSLQTARELIQVCEKSKMPKVA